MKTEDIQLAIIIPAYKRRFLAAAVQSVLMQTDRRFRLYVFDDCSPENLEEVVQPLTAGTGHAYHTFSENLGGTSLADQWSRCVRLTSEPWVWVFSDDDVMEQECVAGFYETLEKSPAGSSVFRFNTLSIGAEGQISRVNQPHPQFEPAIQFAYHRLRDERLSFAPEYLFSRASFDKYGGFVPFPAAWGSDDASWIVFSDDKPIVTIPNVRVRWRGTAYNISNQKSAGLKKIEAALCYLEWLQQWSANPDRHVTGIDDEVLRQHFWHWFSRNLAELHRLVRPSEMVWISERFSKIAREKRSSTVAALFRFNLKSLFKNVRFR